MVDSKNEGNLRIVDGILSEVARVSRILGDVAVRNTAA
jgi:hypothetical protein